MATTITWILLAVGTAIVCAYNDILAGVILLAVFLGIVAVLWVRFYADIIDDEAQERAEEIAEQRFEDMVESAEIHVNFTQAVILGKGYKE